MVKPVDQPADMEPTTSDRFRYGPLHRHHRRIFREMISKIPMGDIKSIVELGCTDISTLASLHRRFPAAELFAFSSPNQLVDRSDWKLNVSWSILDIEREVPDRQFDLVLCSHLLQQVSDDVLTIRNIVRLTARYALIASIQGRVRDLEMRAGYVRSYTSGELREKAERLGLRVVAIMEWGSPFYPMYRDLINFPAALAITGGRYGVAKRLACHALYALLCLNRVNRGDVICILGRKN